MRTRTLKVVCRGCGKKTPADDIGNVEVIEYEGGHTTTEYECKDCAPANEELCSKHPGAEIVEEGSFTGFAGGSSYWAKLSCGCNLVDESNDVRAAE